MNITDFTKKIEEHVAGTTTDLLDIVMSGAIAMQASDIHFEPQEEQVRLRVRVDGLLQDAFTFEKEAYHHLLSRLKILSKIKLNITDKAQDGRFSIEGDGSLIEIRTSSLPSEYGESVVMRILNPKNLKALDTLGLRKDLYDIFVEEIKKPNGMIVVTGPTGAGKTTTLYAFLLKIQNPEIKIITIEDPIEYHIKGISQTQAEPEKGYGFAEGLRSIVRQDPDVILVGEIRDLETAKIALQASLTGHLVLTTLHTNDAAGTIPRLIDLGADAASVASALRMVVAQRLVRKICQDCSGKGCSICNQTGYKGRVGLYEVFLVDEEMQKLILTNPPVSAIKKLAIKKGMITIWESGLIEVKNGATTLEEVKKAVEED